MSDDPYGVAREAAAARLAAPELPYQPAVPRSAAALPIGLIGCGGISQSHLQAYRRGGFPVVALCNRTVAKAEARRAEFFPDAMVTADYRELLARADIRVVDIATPPEARAPLVEAALRAGKHVLSQKPFALEMDTASHLVALADELGLQLAVNQNGRWAPHFSWMREAVRAGLIGEVSSVDFTIHWDHHWVLGTAFEEMRHLVLFDFGIHWFDLAASFFCARSARAVYAAAVRSRGQRARPPFVAHACVAFDGGQAALVFNADTAFGQEDRTTIVGSHGTLRSVGPTLLQQRVTLHTAGGVAEPVLQGSWFPDGFRGAMAELLCAIEEDREPLNSARGNLRSLALSLAAVQSADAGAVIRL